MKSSSVGVKNNMKNTITISNEGASWLDKGQMWMYRNNLVGDIEHLENGILVDILSEDQRYMGTGFLSKESHIVVCILTKDPKEKIDRAFFKKRMQFAYEYRKSVEAENLTNCRLIFGEADQLGGLCVDRYNDLLVVQISSFGMEKNKELLYEVLLEILREDGQKISGIYERNEIAIRKKEGLLLYKGFWKNEKLSAQTIVNENGLLLNIDVENGQKTGYFLDQKNNRLLVRHIAHDKKVLDCFTHTGGFALNAAYGQASQVIAVDVSQNALDQAFENAKLNHLENKIHFVKADVFDYLDHCQLKMFDMIILDPPAFTKSRKTIMQAYNGYKRINKRAMELLGKGGYLVTCTCSRFMEIENFERMLKEAADEAHVILRQVSITQQNHDHPILWVMEETSYLKFYIFQLM